MRLPFVSRRKYEADITALLESINDTCNTGCRTAKCTGAKSNTNPKKTTGSKVGHTHARRGKRVKVTLHSGEHFTAKLNTIEGRFHTFYDHDKVKSSLVKRVTIMRANRPSSSSEESVV